MFVRPISLSHFKSVIFYENSPKIKLFWKKCKIFELLWFHSRFLVPPATGGSAPPHYHTQYIHCEFLYTLLRLDSNCNCNYTLFTKLPWPGDSEGTFRSSSQAATCPSVYHTRWKLHTVPLIAERQAGKL